MQTIEENLPVTSSATNNDTSSKENDLLTRYNSLLDKYPLLTKSVTAAAVQGLGAALASIMKYRSMKAAQQGDNGKQKLPVINWLDVFAFALHGGLVNGPIGHYWFEWLSKHGPKSSFHSMLVDQLLVQPPLLIFMFVFLDATRAAMREVRPSLARTLTTVGPTIVNSWRFWPIAVLCT